MLETRFEPWVGRIPWRSEWPPTPVFLPGEFHGQRSLVDSSPRGSQRGGHDWVPFTFTSVPSCDLTLCTLLLIWFTRSRKVTRNLILILSSKTKGASAVFFPGACHFDPLFWDWSSSVKRVALAPGRGRSLKLAVLSHTSGQDQKRRLLRGLYLSAVSSPKNAF